MDSGIGNTDRILVVDDLQKNIQVIGTVLRENGYLVNVAQSGKGALEILEDVRPDLILLDVMMPEMDGYAVCAEIKSRPEWTDIPVIFLTAKVASQDIVRGFDAGAADYVTKPFNAVELLSRVKTHIELQKSRVQMKERLEKLVAERTLQLRKETEEKIRLKEQLMQVQKLEALGQLAGGIAHDFNNQLTGIIGSLDLINEQYKNDGRIKDYIDIIYQASGNSAKLIEKLLAFAKKSTSVMAIIDVENLIGDVLAIVSRTISKTITIKENLRAVNTTISGDYTLLENAVLNLAINASHAMPKGGTLEISTENLFLNEARCSESGFNPAPGEYIRVSVRDTGTGIDKETLRKIFEPFFTTKADKGTGLGLSAVYSTIEEHAGMIKVDSEPGIGSDFSLFLPVVLPSDRPFEADSVDFSGKKISMLIVDDDENSISVVKEMTKDITEDFFSATGEREALDIYRSNSYRIDIILINQGMQYREGVDLFYMLREIHPEINAIISSGYGFSRETMSLLGKIGIKGCLKKPFTKHQLLKVISDALE